MSATKHQYDAEHVVGSWVAQRGLDSGGAAHTTNTFLDDGEGVTIGDGEGTVLAWVFNDAATPLIDVDTPTVPTFLDDGVYAITAAALLDLDAAADGNIRLDLLIASTVATTHAYVKFVGHTIQVSVTLTWPALAGDPLVFSADNDTGHDLDAFLTAAMVKIA